jgi:hypothetical protein
MSATNPKEAAEAQRYVVKRAVFPRDRAQVIELWRGNLGDPAHHERKFDWFYRRSPTGEPIVQLLRCADGAVGVSAAARRHFVHGTRTFTAGVLVDLTVQPAHRTLFPALTLQRGIRELALTECSFIYGFPNPKAAPIFHRGGYHRFGTITRYVKVLRAAEYLREKLPAVPATVLGGCYDFATRMRARAALKWAPVRLDWRAIEDATLDASALDPACDRELLRGARTADFLRWRFGADLGRRCDLVTANDGGSGTVLGYWVVEQLDRVLHVRDCPRALLYGDRSRRAWAALFAAADERGCRSVSFECLTPEEPPVLHALGMRARSARPVFGALAANAAELEQLPLYLTAADEDE